MSIKTGFSDVGEKVSGKRLRVASKHTDSLRLSCKRHTTDWRDLSVCELWRLRHNPAADEEVGGRRKRQSNYKLKEKQPASFNVLFGTSCSVTRKMTRGKRVLCGVLTGCFRFQKTALAERRDVNLLSALNYLSTFWHQRLKAHVRDPSLCNQYSGVVPLEVTALSDCAEIVAKYRTIKMTEGG